MTASSTPPPCSIPLTSRSQVTLVLTDDEERRLFERLADEALSLFYTRHPVSFGTIGQDAPIPKRTP